MVSFPSLYFTLHQVRVVIVDENDCVPEFLQSIYSKDGVPETVTTATSLLQGETVMQISKVSFCAPSIPRRIVTYLVNSICISPYESIEFKLVGCLPL